MTRPMPVLSAAMTVLALSILGMSSAAAEPGPPPVPPPGADFGPPGWSPPPKVGAPPVFANPHGATDSRGVRVRSNADAAESAVGMPNSVLGNTLAPNQNLGPTHGIGPYAGFELAPPPNYGGGTTISATVPKLEDPYGQPLLDVPAPPPPPTVKPPAAYG